MVSGLVEAWRMSNEVNLYLLEKIPRARLGDRYAARTRDVGTQFAHIHDVRVRWLTHAAPELLGTVGRLPKEPRPTKAALEKALKASARAVERLLVESEASGRVKRWNGAPETLLGYLIAHEAHHRGLAMAAMRLSGHKPPRDVVYGQWQWGKQRDTRR